MVKFYGNVLVSVYNFFRYVKGDRYGYMVSLFYIMASNLFTAACIVAILNHSLHFNRQENSNDALLGIGLVIGIAWLVILARYYTFDKLGDLQKEYDDKTDRQQTLWGFGSILVLVLPALLFIYLLVSYY